jgi:hypothetical protein
MELIEIIFLVAGIGAVVAVYLVFWLISIRVKSQKLRRIGVWVALVIGVSLAGQALNRYWLSAGRPDYVTSAPGGARGTGGALREIPYHVVDSSLLQVVELTMRAYAEAEAKATLQVRYRVVDSDGQQIVAGEQNVDPASASVWAPARFEFSPKRSGAHTLFVDIPKDVDMMDVRIREER